MAKFHKLTKADIMGEPWNAHGKDIQTWWCAVEGEELPVSIGKEVGNNLRVGDSLYGDLLKMTSKKGNDFWKFKGSQVPDGMERPVNNNPGGNFAGSSSETAQNAGEMLALLKDNNRRLKILMGEEEPKAEPAPEEDTTDYDKPIDLGDIPF